MPLNYYCYYCQCRIKAIRRPLPTCSICLQQFVEELPSSSLNTYIDELSQSNEFYDTIEEVEESNEEEEEEEEEDILWYQAESEDEADDILPPVTNLTRSTDNHHHHHSRSHQQDTNNTDTYQQNQFINGWLLQENSDSDYEDDEYETQIISQNVELTQENEDAFRLHDFLENENENDNDNDNEEDGDNGSESTYNDYLNTYALLHSNQWQQRRQENQSSTRSNNDSSTSSPFSNIERLLNIIYQGFYESDNEIDDGDNQGFIGNLMEMFNEPEESTHPPSNENLDIWINLLDKRHLQKEGTDDKIECIICQESFGIFNELIRMPCKHEYHGICLRQWLEVNPTCPICRCHASTILENKSSPLELEQSTSSWDRTLTEHYSSTVESRLDSNDDILENVDHHQELFYGSNDIHEDNDDEDDFYEVSESSFNWVNASLS
ncbi:unnamed protein product [Cunninghamella blakesleeana]